jgi:EAL domain-containing protein (putative c-di-GMP-specific phosphodiesterase class I)
VPIQELVDFFNDRFQDDRVQYLPDEPLRLRGDRVVGQFCGFRISSRFRPLLRAADLEIESHEACTHVTSSAGQLLGTRELFDAAALARAVVYVDRLGRLVHMLNYLVHSDRYRTLFLRVEPRHVLGVRADHGRDFEDVLNRCGLAPAQVVITLDSVIRGAESPALLEGLQNYRRNGYRIAVLVDRTILALNGIDPLLALAPDYARLDGAFAYAALARFEVNSEYRHAVRRLRDRGTAVIQDDVETNTQARFAADAGVELLSGPLAGLAVKDIHWKDPSRQLHLLHQVDHKPSTLNLRFSA